MKMKWIVTLIIAAYPAFINASAQKDTLILNESFRYEGEYPVGKGVLQSERYGLIFGQFNKGIPHGYGVQYLPDGSRYQGNFVEGRRSGHGHFFSDSGKIFLGEFKHDYADGLDTLILENGTVFIGQVRQGRRTRSGSMYQSASSAGVTIPDFNEVSLTGTQKKYLKKLRKNWADSIWSDRTAKYKGGDVNKFYTEYMYSRLSWTKDMHGKESLVEFQFTVSPDGEVTDVEILSCQEPIFGEKVKEVLSKAPKWEPAVKNGKFVPQTIRHRIIFYQPW
ncbi:MAG: hypothetical protein E7117_05110 [Bacteroidales bacterium]|nr:hypothetical protein [Bacteroidales bacterium]